MISSLGLHWILRPEPETEPVPESATDPSPVPEVATLLNSEQFQTADREGKIRWLKEALRVTPEQRQTLWQLTKGQSENPLWASMRMRRLTASNFGDLLGAIKRKRYQFQFVFMH